METQRIHSRGFALIELMVVVAILSVAAAILVPRFLKHRIQGKQGECHQNLLSLLAAEKDYFKKSGQFTQNLETLGWKPQGRGWHAYRFTPPPPPKNGFVFECRGNLDRDAALDIATIDETGRINQLSDDVRQ